MMPFKTTSLLCLIFLLMITGALGNKWSVTYSEPNLCALKGSTVFMNIMYTHPTHLTVENRFWLIDPVHGKELTDLRNESGYSDRVEYLGDEQKHSLRLSNVKKTDEHKYYFRIITNEERERYQGHSGVTRLDDLNENTSTYRHDNKKVTDERKIHTAYGHELLSSFLSWNSLDPPKNVSVSISSSGEIVEGSSVTLTCSSDANPPVENYTWFKGTTSVGKGNTYNISKISSEDSGEYKCKCSNEVRHQDSISVALNVLYPPKNVSVSISSSGEIVEGSSVTLTCSSDANPPVENYTWFKEKESSPVGSGQSYGALQSGQYYCEAQNKHGSERSAAVSITLNSKSDDVNL
ncbi:B-cell receptor CD22-like [Ictalurus punctatus]|uniref:B-cell receptor CD22-like n=1 Tax=Ictalurus punctatus TaxID=7998 RepID=A0A9F7QXI1_ICTPU|nr:B-cell receptor CD22-like [Ictalurus punctatus]